jgi:predicted ATP-dependent Lon-type protease
MLSLAEQNIPMFIMSFLILNFLFAKVQRIFQQSYLNSRKNVFYEYIEEHRKERKNRKPETSSSYKLHLKLIAAVAKV